MVAAANEIADALLEGLQSRGAACAALSGGGTPEPAYARLAQLPLPWPRITFALVDERFVPPSEDTSNEKMLRRALAPALAQHAHFAPMFQPAASVEDAALAAEPVYAGLRLDIAVMGMGEDGHTASWFPGASGLSAALDEHSARHVCAIHAPNVAGAGERLSLTRAALTRAGRVLLLITGERKRGVLEAALSGASPAPVRSLFEPPLPPPLVFWAP